MFEVLSAQLKDVYAGCNGRVVQGTLSAAPASRHHCPSRRTSLYRFEHVRCTPAWNDPASL